MQLALAMRDGSYFSSIQCSRRNIRPSRAQRDRVDAEKVTGQRVGSLCAKELRPGRSRSSRGRFEAMSSKHIPHARRRDRDTELPQLADDPEIALPRVLPSETKDERDDLVVERVRSDLVRTRERPVPANELAGASASASLG